MARQFSTGAKFGSEKGKVQKPARIPPQTSLLAGGKKAVSKLVFKIVVNKSSNINQKTPPVKKARVCTGDWRKLAPPSFARLKLKRARSLLFGAGAESRMRGAAKPQRSRRRIWIAALGLGW